MRAVRCGPPRRTRPLRDNAAHGVRGNDSIIKHASVKLGDIAIGHTDYRYLDDTSRVAFTESTFRLATDNNNPSVARPMVARKLADPTAAHACTHRQRQSLVFASK